MKKSNIELIADRMTKAAKQADAEGKKKSQATIMIELSAPLGYIVNPEGDVFSMIKRDRHSECWPVRSKEFTEWLSQSFYRETEKGCNRKALSDAINTIEARAKDQCKERKPVFLRIAIFGDRIYIDLCDERWRVIEVRAAGWHVLDKSPVHFTRKRGMLPLLEPDVTEKGSSPLLLTGFYRLKRFLNINEEVFPLVVEWLLAALGRATPYPVIVLQGEQGTGKSTTSRIIRSLVDPSTAPLRSPPSEVRDLLVSAVNNQVVVLDNLSGLKLEISDALCRLSTGGAIDARQLYTDLEQVLVEIQRPVIVNGIDEIATRPDLAERSLILNLPPITDDNRRDENTFSYEFEMGRPKILSALLDGLSMALKNHDTVKLEKLPRMADFALWVAAAEAAFWQGGEFMAAYAHNQNEAIEAGIEASPVGTALLGLMEDRDRWSGTPTELLEELGDIAGQNQVKSKAWPQSTKGLKNIIVRLQPSLRRVGIQVEHHRDRNIRFYEITQVAKQASQVSQASQASNHAGSGVTDSEGVTHNPHHVTDSNCYMSRLESSNHAGCDTCPTCDAYSGPCHNDSQSPAGFDRIDDDAEVF